MCAPKHAGSAGAADRAREWQMLPKYPKQDRRLRICEFLALGREDLQPHGDKKKVVFACAPWMLARLMRPTKPAGGSDSRGGGGAAGGSGGGATAKGSEVNADGGERCAMSGCSQAASSCLSWSGVSLQAQRNHHILRARAAPLVSCAHGTPAPASLLVSIACKELPALAPSPGPQDSLTLARGMTSVLLCLLLCHHTDEQGMSLVTMVTARAVA